MIRHKDYLLVTVAPQAKDFEIEGNELYYKAWFGAPDIGHMKKLPPGSWQLIGLAAEITEEQWREMDETLRLKLHTIDPKTTIIIKLIQP